MLVSALLISIDANLDELELDLIITLSIAFLDSLSFDAQINKRK